MGTIAYDLEAFSSLKRSFQPFAEPQKRPRSPVKTPLIPTNDPSKPQSSATQKRPRTSTEQYTNKTPSVLVPSSTFHLSSQTDYPNRAWHVPLSLSITFADLEQYTTYIPKRATSSKNAHPPDASVLRLSPEYGHLVLLAGNDGSAKLWYSQSAKLARTYVGHSKAIRDAVFD
ncbi:Pre-mRNA-processing factor 17 [Gracilariopsis chorda]|uniref:Pre-mRNA-processing factor 17 n=1 Tax=Gracilariopsis chorda TaxID=448386 RepID=A0A2V3IKS5_9FLOR|nr:Pre-mRNA-processing factor 17 [Gracilariopsis chorda]|eukprot:PXF42682.1 Pre-mRNA-processing factor 17 [Gracilariopsis chorda]